MTEQEINKFIKRAAKEAALEAVKSALAVVKPAGKGNYYKQTEARLYAFPTPRCRKILNGIDWILRI